jgi:hypothetical protein
MEALNEDLENNMRLIEVQESINRTLLYDDTERHANRIYLLKTCLFCLGIVLICLTIITILMNTKTISY